VRKIQSIFYRVPFIFAVINNLINQNNMLNKIEGLRYLLVEMLPTCCLYVGYSERKYRLRISLVHPRECHFAHVQ